MIKYFHKLRDVFYSNKLKSKLVRSHLMIAVIGVLMMLIVIILFYWLRFNTSELMYDNMPLRDTVGTLESGLQNSLANLRGWIALGNKKFYITRNLTWQKTLLPNIKKMNKLSSQYDDVNLMNDEEKLIKKLYNLQVWQWRIEAVARTPGNYPARIFVNTYIKPTEFKILSFLRALIRMESYGAYSPARKKLIIGLANFRANFTLSSRALLAYVLSGSMNELNLSRKTLSQAEIAIKGIEKHQSLLSTEELPIYNELVNHFNSYKILSSQGINIYQKKVKNYANYWLSTKAVPLSNGSEILLNSIKNQVNSIFKNSMSEVQDISYIIPYFLAIMTFLIIFISYWLANANARRLIKPISALLSGTKKIAKGELHEDIPIMGKDELGELTENFNRMQAQIKKMVAELDVMAKVDMLTHLPNRNQFNELAEKILVTSQRHKRKFALLLLDIDNFKSINDVYGHDVGDELLKRMALRLRIDTRRSDHIARLGGDEFAIMLTEINETIDAGRYASGVIKKFIEPLKIKSHVIKTSISIGIVCYPEAGDDVKSLLKYADIALYRAKETGKNNFQYFTKSLNEKYQESMSIENALGDAIDKQEFYMVYQPLFELVTRKLDGFEALLRWESSHLGSLMPEDFIPVAEKSGYIGKLGIMVIKQTLDQVLQWKKENYHVSGLNININLSPYQLLDKNNVDQIINTLKSYEGVINLTKVQFELTQTVFLADDKFLELSLRQLSKSGVSFVIDDFGTGYSSLSRIKNLPISMIKIAKDFVGDVNSDENDAAIVEAIIALSKALDIKVIAEGVESQQQIDFLVNLGCVYGQGSYFSKPIAANKLATMF